MKQMPIERKILIPFLIVVILPVIAIGGVAYWSGFQTYQENKFNEIEQTMAQWFTLENELFREDRPEQRQDFVKKWTDQNPGFRNVKPVRERPEFVGKEDGWHQIDSQTFWEQEWIYVQTNPVTGERYVYPLTLMMWTEDLVEVQKYTLLMIMIAGIAAVQLTIILSHHIAKPIRQLADFCRSIGTGRVNDVSLEDLEGRQDEIAVLSQSLQEMVQNLAEKNDSLLRLKEFQDTILQSALFGIYTIDLDGRFLSNNLKWRQLTEGIPLFQERVDRWLQHSLSDEHMHLVPCEEMWQLPSGQGDKYLRMSKVPLTHEDGKVVGILCTAEDVTERKKIEDRMERVDRLASLGEIVAGLAHEIRNPLAGMKTTSQVLRKRLRLDAQNEALFTSIEHEIDRLNKTVTSLLLFSRHQELEQQTVRFSDVLTDTLHMLSKSVKEKGILVKQQVDPSATVYVDPDHLKQILLNLLMNAVKFTGGEGTIHISAKMEGDRTQLKIADNGEGIDERIRNKIFDPFFTTDPGGTGLGLSVVHQLTLQNGGEIDVTSQKGAGTTFTLLFESGSETT